MSSYSESDVGKGLRLLKDGSSLAKASTACRVPKSTLRGRKQGVDSRKRATQKRQAIPPYWETYLANYVIHQAKIGLAPSHKQIRMLAVRRHAELGYQRPLGKHWLTRFLQRHPEIATTRARPIGLDRATSATPEKISAFFDQLQHPDYSDIPNSAIWNMDETGLREGLGLNGLVLSRAGRKSTPVMQPEPGSWITILECVSAARGSIDPVILFKGQLDVWRHWFKEKLDPNSNWSYKTTPKGWTSNSIAIDWLTKHFDPLTRPADPSQKRLLILDGHGSHCQLHFMWLAFQSNIMLLYLPAHTSHILQPLDMGLFAPLKRKYRSAYSSLAQGMELANQKALFIDAYAIARASAFTPENVRGGWRGTGIRPINASVPLSHVLVLDPHTPHDEPIAPLSSQESADILIRTPKSCRDLQRAAYAYKQGPTPTSFFRKLEKYMTQLQGEVISLKEEVGHLRSSLKAYRPIRRKRVRIDPNQKFTKVVDIIKAKPLSVIAPDPPPGLSDAQLAEFNDGFEVWELEYDASGDEDNQSYLEQEAGDPQSMETEFQI
ncbi:DDE superfamily endonuclease, CENP-B-like protein [Cordyceps militaris CM01]|uniref:DDE superfamily endonuclease, CENP-B-like protein n=1 Tax=Cordyceps militaris (strain CM01) TaxID=983644 RepID=G3JG87_CORMM|nr:DDE superfamily endonuclease, CENP-B-like protein [Cordyceps militaris CM01]EGX92365.1 DDE superfamily endonuclease, CENP-B-like protein [Cordyceps militaris CM01]